MNEYVTRLAGPVQGTSELPRVDIADWEKVEHDLGFEIPGSYKELLALVGEGEWGGLLSLHSPRSIGEGDFDRIRSRFAPDFPHLDFFPDLPGLFPRGFTNCRVTLFWEITTVTEKDWSIVILENGFPPETWNLSVPEFIWKHYQGEIESHLFPANLREDTRIRPFL